MLFAQMLLLLAGIILIVKGGDLFVSASVRIAEFIHLPRIVIGATLVSMATTSPELVASVVSGIQGEPEVAIGNAIGSCICNIGLIVGVMAAIRHCHVHPGALRNALLAMFFFGALLWALTLDLTLGRVQAAVLIVLGIAYFALDLRHHLKKARPGEEAEAKEIEEEIVESHRWLHTGRGTAVQFVAGAAVMIVGSKLLVSSAVWIARAAGISPIIIGLTVVAIGTSLPEFVTALHSARHDVADLAVGNVLGANIANLTLVVGAAAALHPSTMNRATQMFVFPALWIMMGLLLVALLTAHRITRAEGFALLGVYLAYIVGLVALVLLR